MSKPDAPTCLNGCNAPICPPSKVICRECLDRIGKKLQEMADGKA